MQFLMSRLQASAISWSSFSAWRNSRGLPTETARVKAWTLLDAAEHLFNGHAQHRLVDHPQNEDQEMAGITQPLHPHLFRHQMLTYLTSKGLTDAQIQLI